MIDYGNCGGHSLSAVKVLHFGYACCKVEPHLFKCCGLRVFGEVNLNSRRAASVH